MICDAELDRVLELARAASPGRSDASLVRDLALRAAADAQRDPAVAAVDAYLDRAGATHSAGRPENVEPLELDGESLSVTLDRVRGER